MKHLRDDFGHSWIKSVIATERGLWILYLICGSVLHSNAVNIIDDLDYVCIFFLYYKFPNYNVFKSITTSAFHYPQVCSIKIYL